MRRHDKKVHMEKVNLLFEQRCNEVLRPWSTDRPDGSFFEQVEIGGFQMSVGIDRGYGDYTMYFPQISPWSGEERAFSDKYGINDQVIRFSEDDVMAEELFNYASGLMNKVLNDFGQIKKEHIYSIMRSVKNKGMKHHEQSGGNDDNVFSF